MVVKNLNLTNPYIGYYVVINLNWYWLLQCRSFHPPGTTDLARVCEAI